MRRKRIAAGRLSTGLLLLLCVTGAARAQPANWALGADLGLEPGCVLVTPEQVIDDGQGDTRVRLHLDATRLRVATASNIDTEFGDVGLIVDNSGFIPADLIEADTDVIFDSRLAEITRLFIAGQRVRLQLRFWPTWPTTGVKSAEFSLAGFTKAYRGLAGCR